MKNIIVSATIVVLAAAAACKNVDEKLVGELQQSATRLETSKPAADTTAIDIEKMRARITEAVGDDQAGKYVVNKMSQKLELTLADLNATKQELAQLEADYESGKVKKEEVEAKCKVLQNKIENYEKAFRNISSVSQRPTEDLIKLGHDMAKSEGLDLSKPLSQDQMGYGTDAQPAPAGTDAGASLQGDGSTKKKDGN